MMEASLFSENVNAIQLTPEKELVAAVIARAIDDARWHEAPKLIQEAQVIRTWKTVRKRARRWLLSNKMHPYSFTWCCAVLSDQPDSLICAIRKHIGFSAVK